jgi:hypothetical protein
MQGENALDANAAGNFTHGKGGVGGAFAKPDNIALENLDAFLLAFNDAHVYLDGVPGFEAGQIHAQVFLLYCLNDVHGLLL